MCLKFACFGYVHYDDDDDDDDDDSRVTTAPRVISPAPYWQHQPHAGHGYGGNGQPQRHGQGVVHYHGNADGRGAATTGDNDGYGLAAGVARQQAANTYPPAAVPDGTWKRPARSFYNDGEGRGGRYYSQMGRY